MKVSIELQPCLKNKSGIGVYTYELTKRLQNFRDIKVEGSIFNFLNRNDISTDIQGLDIKKNICSLFPYGIYRRIWSYAPIKYNFLFRGNADIYQFFNFVIPSNISGKVITTIHDLTYILYPNTMDTSNRKRLEKDMKKTVNRADYIITISENSKSDIIKYLGIDENKIQVVYPGVGETYKRMLDNYEIESVKKKYSIENEYILYLGTLEPRKNIETIIRAYNLFTQSNKNNIKLVLAGKKGWLYDDIFKLIKEFGIEDNVIFTDYVDDKDKPALYQGAKLFLFPSLYEGFGIPLVEAMASRTPVITSNSSSLPEVAGEAAIITAPLDYKEISKSIERVLNDSELREKMINEGVKQANKFSWDASAEKLKNIYYDLYYDRI
ncbi:MULTISPECIES: glycosyltransferase family 1 protein [unclassified Clostridium]|uniref:glycosyltransferase family 4 protein n=1 Tax=unclassified Clostridium TaxID=2614128 RepID=UPI00207A5E1B|nr:MULTISPECIES: glycosyltransferase family 1 protein [unclassified Clostridium]